MLTMTQTMTRDEAEHFYTWLENTVDMEDQHEIEQRVHQLMRAKGFLRGLDLSRAIKVAHDELRYTLLLRGR